MKTQCLPENYVNWENLMPLWILNVQEWQNQENDRCAQRRPTSVWTSARSDQSLCYLHEESLGPYLPKKRTAKTQISLDIRPVWSESLLSAWRKLGSLATQKAHSEDSDQPGYPPSLIRVFAVRMKKAWVLSYPKSAQRRLWSDWADAQADLSLCWAHRPFSWFCHKATHMYFYRPVFF